MMTMRRLVAMFVRRAARGTVAIEFGLAAPFFLTLVVGVVELGLASYQAMEAQDAAEAGALYASENGFDSGGISSAVVNATGNTNITASPAPTEFCGCPSATGVTAIACSTTCTGGSSPGVYVQVNAAIAHQTILSYLGLPIPATLTGQSTVRIQ